MLHPWDAACISLRTDDFGHFFISLLYSVSFWKGSLLFCLFLHWIVYCLTYLSLSYIFIINSLSDTLFKGTISQYVSVFFMDRFLGCSYRNFCVEEIPSAHLSLACLSFWVCLINKATNKPKQTEIKTTAQTNVSFPMLFFSCFIGSVFTFVTLTSGPFVGSSLFVGCSCYSFSEGGFYILQLLLSGLSL